MSGTAEVMPSGGMLMGMVAQSALSSLHQLESTEPLAVVVLDRGIAGAALAECVRSEEDRAKLVKDLRFIADYVETIDIDRTADFTEHTPGAGS